EIFRLTLFDEEIKRSFEIKGILTSPGTTIEINEDFRINLLNNTQTDTLNIITPNKQTGQYSFNVNSGDYQLVFEGTGYLSHSENVSLPADFPQSEIVINVKLVPDTTFKREVISFSQIPKVESIDSSLLIPDAIIRDVSYVGTEEEEIMFFTVQLMALKNPVDITYFKEFYDVKIVYNDADQLYRYTTGKFDTLAEARAERLRIINLGYLDVFTKKVYREIKEN
ncbi:unnamed protein product, partial [marine sediment metagenome]